jgi:hypothetical protein
VTGPAADTAVVPAAGDVAPAIAGDAGQAIATPAAQPALAVPADTGLDSTVLLVGLGLVSIPLLIVMALLATVLTRR